MHIPFKIYNASAGSGKTYMLAKEYLKHILSSNRGYRRILAITFTNKAVNEMKDRILESLFEFSKVTSSSDASSMFKDISLELEISPEELPKKAETVLKEILHNYAFFDISTIDKFTHRLIRTFAKDLNLPQNFEVVLDTDILLDEAVSKLINKAGSESTLTETLIDFALQKADDDKSWDVSFDLNKIGKLLFNETHSKHIKSLLNKEIDDFLVLQKSIDKKIVDNESKAKKIAADVIEYIHQCGLDVKDFPRETLPNHFKKVLSDTFEPSKLYNNKLGENIIAGKILKSGINLPSNDFANKLSQTYEELKRTIYERSMLINMVKNIVPLTILSAIQNEVAILEEDKNQLSISKFNGIISNEIKNQPAPFIYERLGEKYRHYFIDEFQDTSEMQWNNLIPLIDNALSGEGGSLFLVGDAKQAIYRWRGGKAEQFLDLINQKSNPFVITPKIEVLPNNYRSHEEIIKFNNEFFTSTSPMLQNNGYRLLFEEGNRQGFNTKKGGLVQLTFIEENDDTSIKDDYCKEVMATINSVTAQGYQYSDICILVRGNKEGVLLSDFLSQQHIPIISSESLLLKNSSKVQFLVNLIKLQDQHDDLALAYEILHFLSKHEKAKHHFISQNLIRLADFLQHEYGFDTESLKTLSIYDSLELAIRQFDLVSDSDAYINYFMDVVMEVEQKEGIGHHEFLTYWEKKKERLSIVAPAEIDAVQVMTIHKSKGLEFDVVIFPFADTHIYKEIDSKIWLPINAEKFHGFEELLINKKQEVRNYSDQAENLYDEEQYKLELDAFNVLYVALTRAVKALYIISKKDLTKSGEHKSEYYSGLFIHYLKKKGIWDDNTNSYTFGTLDTLHKKITATSSENISYQYSFKDGPNFKILTKSGLLWDTDRGNALLKGNLIHHTMGLIKTGNDVDNAIRTIAENYSLSPEEIENLESDVNQIVQHEQLAMFYEAGKTIYNERDIITQEGNLLRPDRVVIDGGSATIIDYKTGKKNPKYKEQLYSYSDALSTMGFTIENKIIIYINEEITPEFI